MERYRFARHYGQLNRAARLAHRNIGNVFESKKQKKKKKQKTVIIIIEKRKRERSQAGVGNSR